MSRITPEEALKMGRIYTSEVCALARWSRAKLAKKRREGSFPAPIDRGREAIYDASAVLRAIDLMPPGARGSTNPWDVMLDDGSSETNS